MITGSAAPEERFQQSRGQSLPPIQAPQPVFAVLSVPPGARLPAPGAIEAECADIAGVSAIHVDTDRGKIHVLYDGSVSAIEQVDHVLRKHGHGIHGHGNRLPSMRRAHTGEEYPKGVIA